MALEDQIREARTAISQATARKTRAQVELDNAEARLETANATLKDDFEVSTKEEARAKLTELQEALQEKLAQVEEELAEAGA